MVMSATHRPSGGEAETRLEETVAETEQWAQRRIDLSDLAGQTVSLVLEADADRAGTVALWAAPTLSGARTTEKPNIIFYVIDGASADFMSLYGSNRRTTPHLERIGAEGAVFEAAYSNSTWTRPSTVSFLTSLHHSVLGGLSNSRNMVPEGVLTLAEHLHQAGYQTAEFTSNPNAGSVSGLDERGNDWFRDSRVKLNATSSVELHDHFWRWREAYPAEPYVVHFQTTDVHGPLKPVVPFAGLFVAPELREMRYEWMERLRFAGPYSDAFEETGISRVEYFSTGRGLYDEAMAHQDYQIGRLVERLKAQGEWERTLLIVASDHGVAAGDRDLSLGVLDSLPPKWGPYFRSSISRIPLLVVWPDRIQGGQRFSEAVSMIDVLPTILDLAGLPPAEIAQGQSLGRLLLGTDGWEPRPVILDEFAVVPETGVLTGQIEVIDGRWGASLEINPQPEGEGPWLDSLGRGRPARLLLYDLWNDPMCLHSLHEERPDLVEKYTTFLEAQWEAHQALAQQFTPGEESPLTPEQLRTLRALGYLR